MATKSTPGGPPWPHVPRPGRIYGAATVSERGQIALPAEVRRELGIDPGDKLMVFGNRINDSIILIKADVFESFADFFMTKLNKLGTMAQEFLDGATVAEADDDEKPAEATDEKVSPEA